jgi:acyl-CoA synthetase (AMP-forming)/AMP-acid ligase II
MGLLRPFLKLYHRSEVRQRGHRHPEDLKAHVRENLANYKVPREITILTELPRGSTGKILCNELLAGVTPDR